MSIQAPSRHHPIWQGFSLHFYLNDKFITLYSKRFIIIISAEHGPKHLRRQDSLPRQLT